MGPREAEAWAKCGKYLPSTWVSPSQITAALRIFGPPFPIKHLIISCLGGNPHGQTFHIAGAYLAARLHHSIVRSPAFALLFKLFTMCFLGPAQND